MNGRAPLSQAPESEDTSLEGCAAVQTPPRRPLKDLSAALVEDDKTVRVDLSGLALSATAGGEPGGLLNEAPTRRFGAAPSADSERPHNESEPPVLAPRVASGVRRVNLPSPSRPIVPPPLTRTSRGAVGQDVVASVPFQQEATTIARAAGHGIDAPATRILRGITLFAWGFSTATLLWLCLDHPEWRAGIVDRISSLWPAHSAKPSK